MTATLNDQTGRKKRPEPSAEAKAAAELVRAAKEQGLSLTGPDGLLKQLTKTVLETAARAADGVRGRVLPAGRGDRRADVAEQERGAAAGRVRGLRVPGDRQAGDVLLSNP